MAKRFQFRLATVLRMRRMELETQQRAVAARARRLHELRGLAARLDQRIGEQTAAARATLRSGSLSLQQVLWDRHEIGKLRRELMEAFVAGQKEQASLETEQQKLAEALRRVRVLEKYEQRRREAHEAEQRRLERVEEDERGTARFVHANRKTIGSMAP